jgi:hypothetical protein
MMTVSKLNSHFEMSERGTGMERVKYMLLPGLMAVAMSMFSACAVTPPAQEPSVEKYTTEKAEQQPRVPDEYLVTLAPGPDEAVIFEYYKRFGIKYLHQLEGETYLLIVSNDPGPHEMDELIENEARIKLVQPNLIHWDYR